MRRNARFYNLRRFLSVGLAAVLVATATPINTLAAEGEANTASEGSAESTAEPTAAAAVPTAEPASPAVEPVPATEPETAVEQTNEEIKALTNTASEHTASKTTNDTASQAVKDASAALATVEPLKEDADKVESIKASLTEADGYLVSNTAKDKDGKIVNNNVKSNLSDAASFIDAGLAAENSGDTATKNAIGKASDYTTAVSNYNVKYDNNSNDVTTNSEAVVDDANIANTSNSESVARAAAQTAANEYKDVESKMSEIEQAYNAAHEAVEALNKELIKAEGEYKKAEQEYDAANNALGNAGTNIADAEAALADAKAKAELLKANIDDLEAIEEQYRALMVYYFRNTKKEVNGVELNVSNAVYDKAEDGEVAKLNIEKSAASLSTNTVAKAANNAFGTTVTVYNSKGEKKSDRELFMMGRDLMTKLVTYQLRNDYGITADDIRFMSEDNISEMQKNNSDLSKYKYDDTYAAEAVENNKKNQEAYSASSDYYNLKKIASKSGDNGRSNKFVVEYKTKDAEGNDVKNYEYFNYVFKSTTREQDNLNSDNLAKEMAKGPIYLAVVRDSNEVRSDSPYNMDNYQELTKAIATVNNEDYKKALDAVVVAEAKVDTLKKEIEKIESCKLDKNAYYGQLNGLRQAYSQAKGELAAAETNKNELQAKVDVAKAALDGIDLSRFNSSSSSSSSSSSNPSTGTPATTPVVTTVAQAPVQPANELVITGPIVTLFDDAVPLTDIPVRNVVKKTANTTTTKTTTDAKDNTNKKTPKKATVELEEDEVPLAAAPAENIEEKTDNKTVVNNVLPDANDADTAIAWWWWLIVVIVAAIITKVSYEINKKSKENKANK